MTRGGNVRATLLPSLVLACATVFVFLETKGKRHKSVLAPIRDEKEMTGTDVRNPPPNMPCVRSFSPPDVTRQESGKPGLEGLARWNQAAQSRPRIGRKRVSVVLARV